MNPFVAEHSVVRTIWGNADIILTIFAGAAAEFALNKAVDWLYFTGKLPADPLGRLFSTVVYAQKIVFSTQADAWRAIDSMRAIHTAVEQNRGATIPDWAYRDVLYMLIYYSIRAYELLYRCLTAAEKEEVYHVFYQVGSRMGIKNLPADYQQWLPTREAQLQQDLMKSNYTTHLFQQYRKHLGLIRYHFLKQVQIMVVPPRVNQLLGNYRVRWFYPVIYTYKLSRLIKLDKLVKKIIFPAAYHTQIKNLDSVNALS